MKGLLLRRILPILSLAVVFCLPLPARACPFCGLTGQTLTQEINQAALVVYGELKNARAGANGDDADGTTDLVFTKAGIIKDHPYLKGKTKLVLNRYIPLDSQDRYRFLVFCDLYKGELDPYRGLPVPRNSDMPEYLKGALKVKDGKPGERLKFFFKYLDNSDSEIANDALKEFGNADYKDARTMYGSLPADKVAGWLADKDTPSHRIGLYASILGHCSKDKAKHAKLLRSLIEDEDKRPSAGVDAILASYVMLEKKAGWEFTRQLLASPKNDFLLRYAALRAVRFFVDYRADVVSKKEAVAAVVPLLDQSDIADLAIEDLRKWHCWEHGKTILALQGRPSHDIPVIHKAILRFALSCPNEQAKKFVADMRKKDAEMVEDAEELLKLETPPTPATKPGKSLKSK